MGVKLRNGKYWIDYRDAHGTRIRKKIGTNKKHAERIYRAKMKEVDDEKLLGIKRPRVRKLSFDEAVEEYMKWARGNKITWKRDQQSLAHWQDELKGRMLCDVVRLDIERYKLRRKDQAAPRTTNEEVSCLRRLFNRMIEFGFTTKNPVKGVKLLRQPPGRLKMLSHAEEKRLLDACLPQLRPLVIAALSTGMRRGELLALTWDAVDFDRNVITVRNSKNGESREIPMTGRLRATLLGLPRSAEKVFCSGRGTPYKSVRIVFDNAVKRAGLKDFRFHDLRHVFASNLRMKGADLLDIKDYLGHKTLAMTSRYAHVTNKRKQEVIKLLDEPEDGHFLDTEGSKVVDLPS